MKLNEYNGELTKKDGFEYLKWVDSLGVDVDVLTNQSDAVVIWQDSEDEEMLIAAIGEEIAAIGSAGEINSYLYAD